MLDAVSDAMRGLDKLSLTELLELVHRILDEVQLRMMEQAV